MIKMRLPIILSICIIILGVGLTGCASNKEKSDISKNQTSKIETSNFQSKDSDNTLNYNQYLEKIWVVKSWNGRAYDYSSFYISKIENGIVKGKFSTRSVAEPDFYFYSHDPSKYLGDLSGTVNNKVAECQFSDKVGNKGKVKLVFKEKNEIEAKIEYMEKGQAYKDLSLDGKYLFRPYNLADIKDLTPLEEHSFAINLNSWGRVNFVSGEINTGDKVHPAVYLTNEHDDILYVFNVPFQVGSKIIETSIRDKNNDGLKDLMIITNIIGTTPAVHIEWVFYQMDDGSFYNSELNAK